MEIRDATPDDLEAMLAIVNAEIADGVAHFGTEPIGIDEARVDFERAASARPRWPHLVAVDGGAVQGFAKAGAWKPRGAYAWTVELGVYVAREAQRRGVGRALYERLFPAVEALGARTVIAGVTLPNAASVRLHESFGMTPIGVFPRVGWKRGAWHDVGYWVRHLGDPAAPPRALADD